MTDLQGPTLGELAAPVITATCWACGAEVYARRLGAVVIYNEHGQVESPCVGSYHDDRWPARTPSGGT